MSESLDLFAKGCLGTCWYGKYHYMEPWAGCAHDCPYCYARFRSAVTDKLGLMKAGFTKPKPLFPEKELLSKIKHTADSGEINILKLCRYTDIFTPEFVKNGLTLKILEVLAASKIKRIIITTKGVPDKAISGLIKANPAKFSYNAAVRPVSEVFMEAALAPLEKRLAAAAEIAKAGVLTTIHLDPFVAGFDDQDPPLQKLLDRLKALKLNRVMFSYLLLSDEMVKSLAKTLKPDLLKRLVEKYDTSEAHACLPAQRETAYWSILPGIKKESVERTAEKLNSMGFDFVLCSLKNTPGLDTRKFKGTKLCDGKFYA